MAALVKRNGEASSLAIYVPELGFLRIPHNTTFDTNPHREHLVIMGNMAWNQFTQANA